MYETKKQLLQKVQDGDKEEEATAGFDATSIKKKKNHIAQPAASIQLVMFFKLIGNHKVLEQMLIFLKGLTGFSSVFKHFSGISMKVWCWRDAKL